MNKPIISIIVPCYNQAQYLSKALDSVWAQTFTAWECIIVNDGSPDNTEEIARNWCAKDERFKYLHKENGGVATARNEGIKIAAGEFILSLDADDKIGKEYIALAMVEFQNDPQLKIVYGKAEKFGDESGPWELEAYSIENLAKLNMIFCSTIYRKSDWELTGGYDTAMVNGLEDWEFWIAMLKNGGKVLQMETLVFFYRIKLGSRQRQLDSDKKKYLYEYLSVKHADFFVKHLGSFMYLNHIISQSQFKASGKGKSRKYVADLFLRTFFGFSIFGTNKKNLKEC